MPDPIRAVRASLSMLMENVRMSVTNITQNRMRSFLTVLGIMIGVTAVIALITTVTAVSNSITSSFASMGAGTLSLSVTGSDLKTGLSAEDLQRLTDLDCIDGVTPTVSLRTRVSRGGDYETNISVAGRNPYWFSVNPDIVSRGRKLNVLDMDGMHFCCLIDQDMVDTFFYGEDPLEKTMYLSGLPFKVVGIFDADADTSMASMFSGSPDILIPYTTALKLNNTSDVTSLTLYMAEGWDSASASEALEATLDELFSYEEDTYEITTMDSLESTMESMTSMMAGLLGGIASIALLVGGIGIMNMMLTSVTERTVEIGLKKALGAKPRQIQAQFLIESFILSVSGGVIGTLIGLLVSYGLCRAMSATFTVSRGAIALGVGFSALVGIIFGWAPARKASRLNPIDALRRM
ncbi:MAG: ABC transporter permease [Clostridia bacterium]|nr:ABC transporter permease [Clostridia bacterium]